MGGDSSNTMTRKFTEKGTYVFTINIWSKGTITYNTRDAIRIQEEGEEEIKIDAVTKEECLEKAKEKDLLKQSQAWQPWRAYAAIYLWRKL